MFTDASGSLGYATVLGSQCLAASWLNEQKSYQIAIKGPFPIVFALTLWGHKKTKNSFLN